MFCNKGVYVDLGYLGIDKDYKLGSLRIPYKKPGKSKKNPDPKLTSERRAHNQIISRTRICVENSVAGMKRYHILCIKYRGKSVESFDKSIELCAGLWNLKVDRRRGKVATN